MPPIKFLNKIAVTGVCLIISFWFVACDNNPLLKDKDEQASGDQGIVQTTWQDSEGSQAKPHSAKVEKKGVEQPAGDKMAKGKTKAAATDSGLILSRDRRLKSGPSEFAVQIGAFLKADNATRLISRLKTKGYRPTLVIVKTPAKTWNLVRVGSYTEKQAAVAAAKKFTATEKMETAVVKDKTIVKMQANNSQPEQEESIAKAMMPETLVKFEPEKFTYQVGGLRTKANAIKHKDDLEKRGYAPYIKKQRNESSKEYWYTVRIGTFDNLDTAADAAAFFTGKEAIPASATSAKN